MSNELERLIARCDEGSATAAEILAVRDLLLALEQAEPLPLAGAVRSEAGQPDLAWSVTAALGFEVEPIAEAVREEAGTIDIADDVLAMVTDDLPVGEAVLAELAREMPLFDALREEAGRIEIADGVLAALGIGGPRMPLSEAVRGEAGEVEIADAALEGIDPSWPIGEAVRWEAGSIEIADFVLARLGLTEARIPLVAAVRGEAGSIEIAGAVLAAAGLADEPLPIGAAVREEAGPVDVIEGVSEGISPAWVSALLDRELSAEAHVGAAHRLMADKSAGRDMTDFAEIGRLLRAHVVAEAGPAPDAWDAVARRIGIAEPEAVEGWDGTVLAAAVRAEAGTADVADEVMRRVRRAAVAPQIAFEELDSLEPANSNGFGWGAVALAAVALLTVLLGREFLQAPHLQGTVPNTEVAALHFASAGEITVDDLSYAADANVQVIQEEGAEGALIIWIEEETL